MSGIQEASVKSIRPFKTSEEYLYAMKEDLAVWLKELYEVDIEVGTFLDILETGILLCHHANNITQVAQELNQEYPSLGRKLQLPSYGVTCNDLAQAGTFQARDNVSNFIQWCRKEMDIKEVLMFETEDLVLRKNEKNFVLCLLEVARRASRFGMTAPTLIQMEEEIEDEIREDMNLPPDDTLLPKPKREPPNFRNLDQMVQHLVSRCTCPVQFSMVKASEGKYRIGDSNTLIFVRILRNHVMVRVGGGWDTLEHFLDKHDPCQCTSLAHKQALKMAAPQRMQATQVQHEITARLTPRTDSRHKPQLAFLVSRCQSPLPPVEWRTYQPHSVSPGWKKVRESSPSNNDGSKKKEGLQTSQVHSEPRRTPSIRGRERPGTPSQKLLAVEERPGSRQMISTPRRRETFRPLLSSQQNGNVEKNAESLKNVQGPRPRREPDGIQTEVGGLKEETKKLALVGETTQRNETSQHPQNIHQEVKSSPQIRSASPSKLFRASYQQASKIPTENLPGVQEGASVHGWRKNSLPQRSPSPWKHTGQVQKQDCGFKTSGKVGSTFCRPPTPNRNERYHGTFKNSRPVLVKDETTQLDVGQKIKDSQALQRQKDAARTFCTKELVEKDRVYTPLPINPAEEQALYRSLEEEILSNIKELEAESDNHLPGQSQLEHLKEDNDQERDSFGHHLLSMSFPTLSKEVKAYGEGVPRSGVYVPERNTKWHPASLHYDSVIEELSMALHREHLGTDFLSAPPLNSSLVNGNQVKLKFGGSEIPHGKPFFPEAKEDEAPRGNSGEETEVNASGDSDALQTVLNEDILNPLENPVIVRGDTIQTNEDVSKPSESPVVVENMEPPQNKPKRTLKKPERVPSIYKLKLRPKIRPRRDNRPEKRPSKIPTPVAYRYAQRVSSLRGQGRSHKAKFQTKDQPARMKPDSTGNTSTQDGELTLTEGKMGALDDEETWL